MADSVNALGDLLSLLGEAVVCLTGCFDVLFGLGQIRCGLCRVTWSMLVRRAGGGMELLVHAVIEAEFSSSTYLTDTQLSHFKRIAQEMMMKGDRPIDCLRRLSPLKSVIYSLMRLLPFVLVRRAIAAVIALWINAVHSMPSSGSEQEQLLEQHLKHLQAVRAKGWTYLGPLLPASQVSEMVQFLATRELVALNGERFPTSAPLPGVKLASYPIRTVLECPHVIEFINRPDIMRLAAAYLGCTPTVSGLRIDWSTPSSTPGYLQQFHRDYDDWRFVKLFMYLTDVDAESGPHEYVATSHLRSGQLRARPYQRAELERTYGAANVVRVQGQRGTCFMVDTWGVHKGSVPLAQPRVLLQVQYSILPVVKFDYQPVSLASTIPFNSFSNRLLIA